MDVNNLRKDCVYVLNKNEGIIAVFDKDDEDTIIDPIIEEVQNGEAKLTFQVPATSEKWKNTYNPENLYLVDRKIYSANFSDCIEREREDNGTDLITVVAYERQKLLERQYVRAWNSTTGFETIDEFMVVIVSGGDLDLYNDGVVVQTTYQKGSSGYALAGILAGTGWTVGICDVPGTFDLETDFETVYDNIAAIQELWGGIFVFDSLNKVVHHRDETTYLPYSGFEAKYTKNLQSSKYIGDNKIITKLCPLGEGSLNIKDVNNGSIWLENHSYTMSDLEGIENNDDIYEQDQLKAWGERKLAELCKPRKELTLTTAMLNKVEGYELEEVHLNDIVDVIDYEFTDQPSIQLRVIEYKHYLWNGADAELVIGDITLESTDIFKKAVQATNLINNGTLDTSKIVDYYKNGQSLRRTLRQIDQTIIDTTSELSKTDDEIKASVQQTETRVDNLNNDIVSQDLKISRLIINVDGITSEVHSMIDLTETITSYNGKIMLEDAMKGDLVALSIHGYDGYISLRPSEVLYPSDTLYPLISQIIIKISTTNLCPISEDFWEQTDSNEITSDYIEVDSNYSYYFSIHSSLTGFKYVLYYIDCYAEDNTPARISDRTTNSENTRYYLQNGESFSSVKLIFPPKTKKIKIHLQKIDVETNLPVDISIDEINFIQPMLEQCEMYRNNLVYSGELPKAYVKLDCVSTISSQTNKLLSARSFNYSFTSKSGFVITFKEIESDSDVQNNSCLFGTANKEDDPFSGIAFYNRYNGSYREKKLYWNTTLYDINTNNDYFGVKTTVEFTATYLHGQYLYTLNIRDEEGHSETFDLNLPQDNFSATSTTVYLGGRYNSNTRKVEDNTSMFIYNFKINEDSLLARDYYAGIAKNTGNKVLLDNIGKSYTTFSGLAKIGDITYFIPPQSNYVEYNQQEYIYDMEDDLRSMNLTEGVDISSKNVEDYKAGSYNQNEWVDSENYISNYTLVEVQPGQKIHFQSNLPFKQVNFYNNNGTYLGDNQGLFSLIFDDETKEGTVELFSKIRYISFTMKKDSESSLEDAFQQADFKVIVTNIIYDEFMTLDNRATLIKRIGVDGNLEKYVLTNPEYIDYGPLQIPLVEGDNTLEIIGYTPTIVVEYAKQNAFTNTYATKVELNSKIQQTSQSILLEVNQKVGADEIIAKLNLAVEDGQGIVQLIGNTVEINSDYFQLTPDGRITATAGEIANLIMERRRLTSHSKTDNSSTLYKTYTSGSNKFVAGMVIPDSSYGFTFLAAGVPCDTNGNNWNFGTARFELLNDGQVEIRTTNGSTEDKSLIQGGKIRISDVNASTETVIGSSLVDTYYVIAGDGGRKGFCMHGIENSVGTAHHYGCYWSGDALNFYIDQGHISGFSRDCWVNAGTSDERLKHDIEEISQELLDIIEELEIKSFKLNADERGRIHYGIIAQDLIKIAEKHKDINIWEYYMINQENSGYYTVDYDQIHIMKIACLERKVKEQNEIIQNLIQRVEKLEKGE